MKPFLDATEESIRAFQERDIQGGMLMLNLLRYREIADYAETPELAPAQPISGEAAYQIYMEKSLPHLERHGGKVVFFGRGGPFLIGPPGERWDAALLIQQTSPEALMAFVSDPGYLAGVGHRTAALEDSRLLPLEEIAR